jgi:hypothetical protein
VQAVALPDLPDVGEDHVVQFIRDHGLGVPSDHEEEVARGVIRATGGRYAQTLHHLEGLPETWRHWYRFGLDL